MLRQVQVQVQDTALYLLYLVLLQVQVRGTVVATTSTELSVLCRLIKSS